MVSAPRILIVGAGMGGLAAAVELASGGHHVTVLERGARPGGKARSEIVGGRPIDVGPTVLTMRWVFDELFARTGGALEQEVTLRPVEVLARHAWPDGSRLDLFADRERTVDAIGDFAGATEARRYRAFATMAREIWEAARGPFVLAQRPTWLDVVKHAGVHGLRPLLKIDGYRTMWSALEQSFDDPRLRQLFGRYATYCGGSPFEAPATFNLVSHVESEGVVTVDGGISALATALARRAERLGAEIRYEADVAEILVDRRVRGVRLASGETVPADVVLANSDVSAVGAGLFGAAAARAARPTPPDERSLSAVTFAIVARTSGDLVHHNVAFSSDYAAEFQDLLVRRRAPREPTVYVCAQDRGTTHPVEEERLFVIVNAPATGDEPARWTDEEKRRCEHAALGTLRQCGWLVEPSACLQTTPVELERAFPATGGALYGPRPRGPMSAFARAGARSKVPGLYFAGGSVHPGPGVPMAALSGTLAAASIRQDLRSTTLPRRADTRGSASTASATTDGTASSSVP